MFKRVICFVMAIGALLAPASALLCRAYDYGGCVGFAIFANKGQGTWTSFNDGGTSGISISGFSTLGALGANQGYGYVAFPLELIGNVEYSVMFEVQTAFVSSGWLAATGGLNSWVGLYDNLDFTETKNNALASTGSTTSPYFTYDSTISASSKVSKQTDYIYNASYTFTPDSPYRQTLCFPMTFSLGFMQSSGDISIAINSISVSGDPNAVDKALNAIENTINNIEVSISEVNNGIKEVVTSINESPEKTAEAIADKEKEEASKADSDANSAYEQNKDMLGALDFTDNLSFLDTAFSYVSNTAPLSSFTLPDIVIPVKGSQYTLVSNQTVDFSEVFQNQWVRILLMISRGASLVYLIIWALSFYIKAIIYMWQSALYSSGNMLDIFSWWIRAGFVLPDNWVEANSMWHGKYDEGD